MHLHTVGELVGVNYRWLWYQCTRCERPAKYRIGYVLPNARRNPASSAYGCDDISWCSDQEEFACQKHVREMENPLEGYEWCSTFTLKKFQHMGFYKDAIA